MHAMKKKSTHDLRDDDRIVTEVAIICRPYASAGNERSVQGVMRNFSSQGSYIELDRKFKSGTILIVRTVGCLPTPALADRIENPRSICLGEIKWGQDLDDAAQPRYGMGLRYLD